MTDEYEQYEVKMENESALPEIRPELVKMATQPPDMEFGDRNFPPTVKIPKDATPEERMAMMATGASLERVRELQNLPKGEGIAPDLSVLTGDAEIDAFYRECIKCFQEKGAEYTVGSKDRLANFRGVAEDVGIPMEKAWYVFFNKHLRALQSYIKNGCQVKSNEPISGRIMDLVVYLTLFHKMVLEIERKRHAAQQLEAGNCA